MHLSVEPSVYSALHPLREQWGIAECISEPKEEQTNDEDMAEIDDRIVPSYKRGIFVNLLHCSRLRLLHYVTLFNRLDTPGKMRV